MLIDYEKAFDSLSWECIEQTLKIFNFNSHITQWVKTLQNGSYSKISQNEHLSCNLPLIKGCHQGDPVSPYIFAVCGEVLAEANCNNDDIKGIEIFGEEHVISPFADDTTLLLAYSLQNVRTCLKIIEAFKHFSGLKMNPEKTQLIK